MNVAKTNIDTAAIGHNQIGVLTQMTKAVPGLDNKLSITSSRGRRLESPVLKKYPHEFLVSESLVLPKSLGAEETRFTYLKLTKAGFTTFEAIDKIAQHFRLPADTVQFAGLKDEDAITEQIVAIDAKVAQPSIELFNNQHMVDPSKYIEINYHSVGNEPIRIGQLNGNSFRIVVRNLSPQFAEQFRCPVRFTFQFLNYYDIQRFGLANQTKITHLIGKALIIGDYCTAFELLKRANTMESAQALAFEGSAEEFFSTLSRRVVNFMKDSFSSYVWNKSLSELVSQVCDNDVYQQCHEGIPFLFTWRQSLALDILMKKQFLEFTKYYGEDDEGQTKRKFRNTVIQTQILINELAEDEEHEKACKCAISFFLPSGCYATMCIRQMVNMIDLTPSN